MDTQRKAVKYHRVHPLNLWVGKLSYSRVLNLMDAHFILVNSLLHKQRSLLLAKDNI